MHQSPENYIRTRARNLPLHECLITEKWEEAGMASVLIARKHSNGNITLGFYLVDTYCLGVKDTFYQFNIPEMEYEQLKEKFLGNENFEACEYVLAHNVVYGAYEYAEDYGFSPHKDFTKVTQYMLEADDEKTDLIDIEFGRDGNPCLFAEIGKEPVNAVKILERTAGPGNYTIIYVDEEGYGFEETDEFEDKDPLSRNAGEQLELFGDEFPRKKTIDANNLIRETKDIQNTKGNTSSLKKEKTILEDKKETGEWRKLFELMIEIKELQPWTWMYEDEIFAIRDPDTNKTVFVSVMGELGEHISIAAYMGDEGIYGFWSLQEAAPNITEEMFMEIPQLQASFENRSMLHPRDLARIKKLGLKFRGKSSWPMIRSFRPGYFPWFPESWERKFMIHVLEQTIIMAKRLKEDPDLFEKYNDGEFLIRIPDTGTEVINWQDSVIQVPPPSPRAIHYGINIEDMEELKSLPLTDITFETDLVFLPSVVEEKGINPYYSYLLMIIDPESGMIIGNEILIPVPSLEEMWKTVPQHLVNTLIRTGNRPKELHVQSELIAGLIEQLAGDLGIDLQLKDRLKALESAKKEFLKFMGQV